MASAITQFIVGAALALPALKSPAIRRVMPASAILVSAGMPAVAPDFDTFAMQAFAISYFVFPAAFWRSFRRFLPKLPA